MGSRSKWEDMISNVTGKLTAVLSSSPEKKAEEASKYMGSGLVNSASNIIRDNKEKKRKALEEAGM